jgi:hypothetical protein
MAMTCCNRALIAVCVVASLVACSSGSGNSGGNNSEPATVTVSGQLQYERPLHLASCQGLDFSDVELRPIRAVTVRVFDAATNSVLASAVTDDNGVYSMSVTAQSDVFVRARAELKRPASPSWDVEVRDNTCDDADPDRPCSVPLQQRPMYALDSATINTGAVNRTINMTASTGWDIAAADFVNVRAAAPFAALDTVYGAMLALSIIDPGLDFPALDVFWSVNNTIVVSGDFDIDSGEIRSTFYVGGIGGGMFLVGAQGLDIEEFDSHVITHEWVHYFEDMFSRSDTIGGTHGQSDNLDIRTAFGEGFASGVAAVILQDPVYCDALWFGATLSGFGFSIEDTASATPGWYDEFSIQQLIYDLWDDDVDGVDSDSIGFTPIYNVMTGAQIVTPAFSSVFTFFDALRNENPAATPFIDALLSGQNINGAGIDLWGSSETNDAGGALDVLPIYTEVVADGTASKVCSNSQFDFVDGFGTREFSGNRLGMHQFLRMTVAADQRLDFSIVADAATLAALPPDDVNDSGDQSDPDLFIYRDGVFQNALVMGEFEGRSGVANLEEFTTEDTLLAGDYVMDLFDFRFGDPGTDQLYPSRTCFDLTITVVP